MNIFSFLLIAVSLAMGCFAIALGINCSGKAISRIMALGIAAISGRSAGRHAGHRWRQA